MAFTHIFFDLDGTLTDSKDGIVASFAYALDRFSVPHEGKDLSYVVGPVLKNCFRDFGIGEDKYPEALGYFREKFSREGMWDNRLFEGTVPCLRALVNAGKHLYIVTSKPQYFAERIAEYFGIRTFFEGIAGGDMNEKRTEKADLLRDVLKKIKPTARDSAVMVGDRKFDISGAKETGIASIGVLWGIGDREELKEADYLCPLHEDLLRILI